MNGSDGYYLKEGRLELSMLDDNDDEIEQLKQPNSTAQLNSLEFEHTRRRRERSRIPLATQAQPKLKVSKEVYNTLHEMGQFLTQSDEESEEDSSQIVSIEVEPVAQNVKLEPNKPVSQDQLVENAADDMRQLLAKQLESMVYPTKLVEDDSLEFERDAIVPDEGSHLEQKKVDDILATYFQGTPSEDLSSDFMQELKVHIEKKIADIKNYE